MLGYAECEYSESIFWSSAIVYIYGKRVMCNSLLSVSVGLAESEMDV